MFGKKRILFSLLAISVLTLQLLSPVPARADEGTPTNPLPTLVVDVPTSLPTDPIAPTDLVTPTPTEQAIISPTPLDTLTEATPLDPTATPTIEPTLTDVLQPASPVDQILAQVPEGTQVVVFNDDGQKEPLASQVAEQIIMTSDPVWCPIISGVASLPGDAGCTINHPDITSLLSDPDIAGDGVIYFTGGNYSGPESSITLDGSLLNTWGAITLQGGWNGLNNGSGYGLSGQSTFSIPIQIDNWNSDVTLNNIDVNGAGLSVATTGNIALNDVNVTNPSGTGVTLNNTNSSANSSVTVANSSISNNGFDGLYILSNGRVSLSQVTATGNAAGNTYINNSTGSGGVVVAGSTFSNSGLYQGLTIYANSSIAINGVTAQNNAMEGIWLNTSKGPISVGKTAPVNATGNDKLYGGTDLLLYNVTATNPTGDGAYINLASGSIAVTNSLFTGNLGNGLSITSTGPITLTNVTAGLFTCSYCGIIPNPGDPKSNGGNGVIINQTGSGNINIQGGNFSNNQGNGLLISQTGGDTNINLGDDVSRFNNNDLNGIHVDSTGNVSMSIYDAMDNGGDGVMIKNSASINSYNGWMWNNGGNGATLISNGDIHVNGYAEFLNNAKYGAQFQLNNPATFFLDCVLFDNNKVGDYGQIKPAPVGSKFLFGDCSGQVSELSLNFVSIPSGDNSTEFVLDCSDTTSFVVRLPNEDRITILCPVKGNAQIKRLTNTMLPSDLPEGYSYLSAFSVNIIQNKKKIDVIKEGGFIRYSFAKPLVTGDSQFAILYWDEATNQWLTLPAYSSYKKQDLTYPALIQLSPADVSDRLVIGGTSVLPTNGRVEVSTNFPGIFVLVQK